MKIMQIRESLPSWINVVIDYSIDNEQYEQGYKDIVNCLDMVNFKEPPKREKITLQWEIMQYTKQETTTVVQSMIKLT